MNIEQKSKLILESLDDLKAHDIESLDVQHLTDLMDIMIICSATSTTHAKSIAKNLAKDLKDNKVEILGVEGDNKSDWVLVDTGDIVTHIMLEETRKLYALEKLWDIKRD